MKIKIYPFVLGALIARLLFSGETENMPLPPMNAKTMQFKFQEKASEGKALGKNIVSIGYMRKFLDKYYKKNKYMTKTGWEGRLVRESGVVKDSVNLYAVNKWSGARGPWQIMEDTWYEHSDVPFWWGAFDPDESTRVSMEIALIDFKRLKRLNPNWKGLSLLIKSQQGAAVYNCGIGRFGNKYSWNLLEVNDETDGYYKFVTDYKPMKSKIKKFSKRNIESFIYNSERRGQSPPKAFNAPSQKPSILIGGKKAKKVPPQYRKAS